MHRQYDPYNIQLLGQGERKREKWRGKFGELKTMLLKSVAEIYNFDQ